MILSYQEFIDLIRENITPRGDGNLISYLITNVL